GWMSPERTHLRTVLVALRQRQERIADALDPEPLQLGRDRGADAVQRRNRLLEDILVRPPRRLSANPAAHHPTRRDAFIHRARGSRPPPPGHREAAAQRRSPPAPDTARRNTAP